MFIRFGRTWWTGGTGDAVGAVGAARTGRTSESDLSDLAFFSGQAAPSALTEQTCQNRTVMSWHETVR